jgi:uncharacterized protein (TIGR00255 family)
LRAIESGLRELISARVQRGKVECRIAWGASATLSGARNLNGDAMARLAHLAQQAKLVFPDAAPLSLADILRWPGISGDESPDPAVLHSACLELARSALDDFQATRAREGDKLAAVIRERLVRIGAIVAVVGPHIPAAQAAFEERLRQRLAEAADDERIRQEVVLFASRIDVAEELARLTTHVSEVGRVLDKGGAVGKRLDFLMQELNREANTLGSKSVVQEVSAASMDLKLLIEQMREQIQNLE